VHHEGLHPRPARRSGLVVIQRGCELALFQPGKSGNMDCTFCLECVQACPHDNVGILSRPPASELMTDPRRSGIGYFSRRPDIAALALVFTFGALLNAFGMVSPVYALERWLGDALHTGHEAPVLGSDLRVLAHRGTRADAGLAAWLTRVWAGSRRATLPLIVRYAYGLVPLGFGMWLAHYSFHFLTGFLTLIPVTQNAVASLGTPLLGEPLWTLTGIPTRFVQPLELGFLVLGLTGSLLVTIGWRRTRTPSPGACLHPLGCHLPAAVGRGGVADFSAHGDARHIHGLADAGTPTHRRTLAAPGMGFRPPRITGRRSRLSWTGAWVLVSSPSGPIPMSARERFGSWWTLRRAAPSRRTCTSR
jgi:hypothetical protein